MKSASTLRPRIAIFAEVLAAVGLFAAAFFSAVAFAGPEDPEEGGQWGSVIQWPHIAVSAANLPDGRVLTWSGSEREAWPTTEQTYSATWDPATGSFQEIFHPSHNMFCAHQVMLEDGRVFVNGGRNKQNSPWTSIYDPTTSQWSQIASMAGGGRWYPTTVLMPDGDVFTALGTATTPRYGELWNPGSGWQIKNGIDFNTMVLDDYFTSGSHSESDWWPLLHVAPNGKIFHSGPTPKMHYIDPTGNGSFNQTGPQFTGWYHKHGATIMYAEGKLLTAGGWLTGTNRVSTNRAFTIDLNGPAPAILEIAPMTHARKFHNAVILPTGEVMMIGGNTSGKKFSDEGAILPTEIWSPITGQWRLGASITVPRNYHSTAILLTDGRVLSAGGGYGTASPSANHKDGQVYSPSYLFDATGSPAARPSIQSAPSSISVGQQLSVQATTNIQQFSLIKMSSTTHAVNTDVRFLNVPFSVVAPGSYSLVTSNNENVMTPGYWMLFAVDAQGVPSIAHILRVYTSGLPWISNPGDQSGQIETPVQLQIVAGDADGDPLTYGASGLPPGLTIASGNGLISGTPDTIGSFAVIVTVDDLNQGTDEASFQWTIDGSVAMPDMVPPGGVFNSPVMVTLSSNTSGATIYYTVDGSDPNEASAVYSGSPILVDRDTILKARAYKSGLDPSDIANASFSFQSVPADGLVGYWTFDEGAGTLASDGSGNGNHGTLSINALWAGSGHIGSNALRVAGTSESHARVADSPNIRFGVSEDYTVSFWAKVEELPNAWQAMVWKANKPARYSFSVSPLNTIRFNAGNGGALDSNTAITAGVWHHIVGVQDNQHPSKKRRLYVGGVEVAAASTTQPSDGLGDLFIGSRRSDGYEAFDGDIDEVRIYDRALSDVEILALNGQSTEPLPPVADAGPDRTFIDANGSGDEPVTLDGSGSGDPDGTIVNYRWTKGATVLADGSSSNAVAILAVGLHTIDLEVTDNDGLTTSDSTIVSVEPRNLTSIDVDPVSASLAAGDAMQFNAAAFDQVGAPMTAAFEWSVSGGGGIDGNGLFTATTTGGPFDVEAIAEGVTGTATVSVTVDIDPVVSTPQVAGSTIEFSVNAGAGNLLYNWSFGDGTLETGFGNFSSISHTYSDPGRYIVILTVQDPASGQEWTQTIPQLVHAPLTANMPRASSSIMIDGSGSKVWNVNPDNDTVSVIDTSTNTVLVEIPVADQPVSLAEASDGTIWVVSKRSATISVVDSGLMAVVDTIALAHGSRPHGIVFSNSPAYAFVALEATGVVKVLDASTRTIVPVDLANPAAGDLDVYLGSGIRHLSITEDDASLLVSHYVTPPLPNESTTAPVVESGGQHFGGQVTVVDTATMTTVSTLVLRHSDRAASEHTGPGVPNYLGPAVISPDGLSAWVASKQDNILAGGLRGGDGMTFDQTVRAISSKIDLTSGSEDFVFRVDHDNAGVASYAVFGPYGAYLFTALESNREVAISDSYTGNELLRFDVGRAPQGLAFSTVENTIYVHNFMDRSVGIYEISGIGQYIVPSVTEVATISTVGTEALLPDVLLGKQLFYDARDERLARDSYMSCASCHNEGGQDGRVWDFTGMGEGLRNTIALDGKGGMAHGFLHWTANFDEVQDFEGQIRNFAGGTGLMSDNDYFGANREQPLGGPKAGLSADLDALAAFIAALDQVPDSPYRNADGTLNAYGMAGLNVFVNENCANCHTLPRYTDSAAGNVHDGIDTPTLLGVWQTAPYLHDGSALDLTEAVTAHAGSTLGALELDNLASYLQQLDAVTGQGVALPEFSPPAGNVTAPVEVFLSTITAGADIYYTLNGTDPNEASLYYTGAPILVGGDTTIRARAYRSGLVPSNIVSASYVFATMPVAGLVAHWSFDEGAGSSAADSSGNGNTAILAANASWSAGGYVGGSALTVNGDAGSHVRVADAAGLRFAASEDYTVSFWAKLDALPGSWQTMFWKGAQPARYSFSVRHTTNKIRFNAGNRGAINSPNGMTAQVWYHIVGMQDNSHASKKRRLYVNGIEVASKKSTEPADGAGDLFIGSRRSDDYEAFIGEIDEVRIYNRALTDEEIQTLSGEAQ